MSIPNVIARKHKPPTPLPTYVENISRPRKGQSLRLSSASSNGDEYAVNITSDDPVRTCLLHHAWRSKGFAQFDTKIASITVSLRERMRFYKLRVTPNAASIASTFNARFKPEIIPEVNDPFLVDWIQEPLEDSEILIGERVCIRFNFKGLLLSLSH